MVIPVLLDNYCLSVYYLLRLAIFYQTMTLGARYGTILCDYMPIYTGCTQKGIHCEFISYIDSDKK